MTFKVLIADKLAEQGLAAFADYPEVDLHDRAGISRDDLIAVLPGFDALVVRSRTNVDRDILSAGRDLKVVGRAGIGVDNIDVKAATRLGVVVMNTPDGNATTTAEHTLAMIMAMTRFIPQATASMKAGKWEKNKFTGHELCGKTLGIIGLGNIGRIVADRAQGLRMQVVGYDPFFDAAAAKKLGVELVPVEEVLRRADVLTVHTPLTDETRGLIGDAELERMKPGVMLVNCARGGIYDEGALVRGLEAGKIGALALDVFEIEPPPADHPLLKFDNVICTPHLGASTEEAQVQVAVDIARQIGDFARGEPARNAINLPRISPADLRVLGPYVDLAEKLGSFVSQLVDGPVRKVEVRMAGEIGSRPVLAVGNAAVAGVLAHAFDRPVNAVNARVLAAERGIEVIESVSTAGQGAYSSTVQVALEGADGRRHGAVGTLFAKGQGRLVEVDGIPLEAVPQGYLLVINNPDQPGVIGRVGTVLGEAGVNISRMHLGLEDGQALSLVNVDQPVPEGTLDQVREHVTWVKQVNLSA